MQIVKYETEEEADKIKIEKKAQGMILTNVANVTEGNFLGFKEPDEIPVIPVISPTIDERLTALEVKIDSILTKTVAIQTATAIKSL